ncbi:hypothetical protein FG167_11845 [Lacinutrix sp. WUR7]|uniref:hypothetical protein n=1 Tax=Lacinutrix sp. WUR7 TaxID=2653681 RepID=UPI00193DFE9C|nr:hypothetical protein [Lacinutrix sp. WUR7]QRM89893.1 hypothetical protein FG167_11845 [Lacinutrix sp. WUR7]
MKQIMTSIILLLAYTTINAQYNVNSDKYKIAFTSPEALEQYETEAETVLGYENNNFAVDIEIIPIAEQSPAFIKSQKEGAYLTAKFLGLKDIKNGAFLPHIESAFYVIAYDQYEETNTPVYIIAFINKELGLAYEVTVYCYNIDLEAGRKIANSFKWLE